MTTWAWASIRLCITSWLAFNAIYGVAWLLTGWHNELNWLGIAFFHAAEIVLFYLVFGVILMFQGPPTTRLSSYRYGASGQYEGYVDTYVPTPPSTPTLTPAPYADDLGFNRLLQGYWTYFLITRLIFGHATMVMFQMTIWGWLVELCA